MEFNFFKKLKSENKILSDFKNENGVILGKNKGKLLIDNSKEHILLTMPTRSGKGASCIIPTALKTWKESLFVFDLGGENYHLTSGARKEKLGNHILRFSPSSKNSCHYNPLAEVRILSKYEKEDIKMITEVIFNRKELKSEEDILCSNFSSKFITSVIYYVLYRNFLKKPKFIYENGEKIPVSNATIMEVIDFIKGKNEKMEQKQIKTFEEKIKKICEENIVEKFGSDEKIKNYVKEKLKIVYETDTDLEIINNGNHPKIVENFSKYSELSFFFPILKQSIYNLSIFDIPEIKENISTSDFRMVDLMNFDKPVSFYFVISPADIIKCYSIIKIFIKQMFDRLTPEIDYRNEIKHKWKMLAIMDEFPSLGKIEEIEMGMGYFAGYGMKMMIVLQSLDQLFKIYGDKNRFLSNCKIQVFGQANDKITADYINNLCKEKNEKFITNEELLSFPLNKVIIKKFGEKPIIAEKFLYYKEKEYFELSKIPFVFSEKLCDDVEKNI